MREHLGDLTVSTAIHPVWRDAETGHSLLELVRQLRNEWNYGGVAEGVDVKYSEPRPVLLQRIRDRVQQESSFRSEAAVKQLQLVVQSTGVLGECGIDWGVDDEKTSDCVEFWNEMSSVIRQEFERIENPFVIETWDNVLKNAFFLEKTSAQTIEKELKDRSEWVRKPWTTEPLPGNESDVLDNEVCLVLVLSLSMFQRFFAMWVG